MRVGFVSVRFAGLDGVSLEAAKVADVLTAAGHDVVWFAGELSSNFAPGTEFEPARFDSSTNLALQEECFGVESTSSVTLDAIETRATELEVAIREFMAAYSVDVLVPQNSLAIPMQLPLGVALARLGRAGVRIVAHHHDFAWERDRFYPNGVGEILASAFPPVAPSIEHLVINSLAQRSLREKTGAGSSVLPNVMDFENRPTPGDGAVFRRYANLGADDTVLLQPTRIIPRKSIELTLELAAQLDDRPTKVVVTHPGLDQGNEYAESLVRRAAELGVDYRVAPVGGAGQPSLADAYAAADLVTYPSRIEGFGNALLEALYYGRPLLVNRYPVYVTDIAVTGIDVIEMDGAVTPATLAEVRSWLGDATRRQTAAERNYEICLEHFSYAAARRCLLPFFDRAVAG